MPPTVRDGILFIDDSQQVESIEELVKEFTEWGQALSPAPVGFQYGYLADKKWWGQLQDPPKRSGYRSSSMFPTPKRFFGWISRCWMYFHLQSNGKRVEGSLVYG